MLVGMLPLSVLAKTDDTISLDISEGSITIENGTNAYTFKVTQGSNTADNIDPLTIFEISGTTTSNSVTVSANQIYNDTPFPVKITLNGVNIDVSGTSNANAFYLTNNTTVNMTLYNSNTLKSGFCKEGLSAPNGTTLTVSSSSTGTLNAVGGGYGAGIGSGQYGYSGTVIINGGTITATGGAFAAGIGSGREGSCGTVIINGGTVTAQGGSRGAGIGGGIRSSGGTIIINSGIIAGSIGFESFSETDSSASYETGICSSISSSCLSISS